MILIGLGGNLPHPKYGAPRDTLAAALRELEKQGIRIVRRSRWYSTPPDPPSGQPWYTNGVALAETGETPAQVLARLLEVETRFGRKRRGEPRNAPRTVDLDLLDYDGVVQNVHAGGGPAPGEGGLQLPHPRLHTRPFVLYPLAEVAPHWTHPVLHRTVEELIAALPPGAEAVPIESSEPIWT